MNLKKINAEFSYCQVTDYSKVNFSSDYCFIGKTAEENSLLCLSEDVPHNAYSISTGWKGFYIDGIIDFSLFGIVSGIISILADNRISIKVMSTHNTDYIFVMEDDFDKALNILKYDGYKIVE